MSHTRHIAFRPRLPAERAHDPIQRRTERPSVVYPICMRPCLYRSITAPDDSRSSASAGCKARRTRGSRCCSLLLADSGRQSQPCDELRRQPRLSHMRSVPDRPVSAPESFSRTPVRWRLLLASSCSLRSLRSLHSSLQSCTFFCIAGVPRLSLLYAAGAADT